MTEAAHASVPPCLELPFYLPTVVFQRPSPLSSVLIVLCLFVTAASSVFRKQSCPHDGADAAERRLCIVPDIVSTLNLCVYLSC